MTANNNFEVIMKYHNWIIWKCIVVR